MAAEALVCMLQSQHLGGPSSLYGLRGPGLTHDTADEWCWEWSRSGHCPQASYKAATGPGTLLVACLKVLMQTRYQMSRKVGWYLPALNMQEREKAGVGVCCMVMCSSQGREQKCSSMRLWMRRISRALPMNRTTSVLKKS